MPGEHPVSSAVADPFADCTAPWKRVMSEVKARSQPYRECIPGYFEFTGTVLMSLATQFFHGEIGAEDLIARLEERGNRFFARQQQAHAAAGDAGNAGLPAEALGQ